MSKQTMNDAERRLWVENDEGLYSWWKSSRIGLYLFVKENRAELTRMILGRMNREPAEKRYYDYY